jgi:hypothetical protein
MPSAVGAYQLPDGKSVEELVGDKERRSGGNLLQTGIPMDGAPECASVLAWLCRSTGLVSTRATRAASTKPVTTRAARKRSAISVPRPGPNSIRWYGDGAPIACQVVAHQMPMSSPKICEISGAVVKSPARPRGSWRM